jgi:copper ion binding protein
MTSKTFSVPDIHCGGCASSIEGAVSVLDGVADVKVTLDTHTVDVEYDESAVPTESIIEAIEDQGYVVAR